MENKGVEETLGKIFLSSEIYAKVGEPLGLEGYYADQLEGLTESEISVIYYRSIMGTHLSANGYKSSGQDVINAYKKHLDDLGIDYDNSITYKSKKTKKLNDKSSVKSGSTPSFAKGTYRVGNAYANLMSNGNLIFYYKRNSNITPMYCRTEGKWVWRDKHIFVSGLNNPNCDGMRSYNGKYLREETRLVGPR